MSRSSPGDLQLTTKDEVSVRKKSPAFSIQSPGSPKDRLSFNFSPNEGYSSYVGRAVPTSGSETSSDESVELYREKLEHLQILIRQLNKQLQSEKIRSEGVETLSRCLKDEQQENDKLKSKLKNYEQIIQTLQSRLAAHNLPTSVELKLGESVVPGIIGQSTFDSLVKENLSLKSELRYLTIDPSKMDDLLKENNHLREQMLDLQKQLAALSHEKQEVHSFLSSTDDDKVHEIVRLREELNELRQRGVSKDVLCQSLSEQSQALKERLRETGQLCQQLLQRLEQLESSRGSQEAGAHSHMRDSFVKMNLTNSLENDNGTNTEVHREIQGLRSKLQEVVEVNQKWQEYHDRREVEFTALQGRLQARETELSTAACVSSDETARKHQQQIDKLVKQYKQQLTSADEEREKLSDENRHLRIDLNKQITDNQKLEDKIKVLIGQLRNRPVDSGTSQADRDRIKALEMQIRVCTEDFESERRDRERAHGKIADMERELQIYKSQLESFQRGAAARIDARRRGAYNRQHHANYVQCDLANLDDEPMPEPSPIPPLIGRGIYQTDDPIEDDEGEDTIDSLPIRRPSQHDEMSSSQGATSQKKVKHTLQCPQCNKTYAYDNHSELLQHMDACLK